MHPKIDNTQTSVMQKFLAGQISFSAAQNKLGKSRATIYRYAKMVSQGKSVIDKRKFGNNRKYGSKQAD